jgi:hypothetical protein
MFKFLTPLYIPLSKLEKYLQKDKQSMEISILKSIFPNSASNENCDRFIFHENEDLLYP